MKYTDAHCHIIDQSCDFNITARVCNATTEADWEKLVKIANNKIHVCIGIHPWYINTASTNWDNRMRKILLSNPDVMIGEIGLDKYHPDITTQINFFITQLEIAIELNRSIHLHVVGAWDKMLNILKKYNKIPPIIAHGFNGNTDIMKRLVDKYDIYFSYSGKQFEKTTKNNILNCIMATPQNKLLLESDTNTHETELKLLQIAYNNVAQIAHSNPSGLSKIVAKNLLNIL